MTVQVPKLRSKTCKPVTFRSASVPPQVQKANSVETALPWLYLKGISTGEMGQALKALAGPDATGFSAKTVSRLKACGLTAPKLAIGDGAMGFRAALEEIFPTKLFQATGA